MLIEDITPESRSSSATDVGFVVTTCVHIYIYVCMYMYISVHVCVRVYKYICMYMYMNVCLYIHSHIGAPPWAACCMGISRPLILGNFHAGRLSLKVAGFGALWPLLGDI